VRELFRLLSYAKRYLAALGASVVLLAMAGAAHAMLPVLIGPVFDRVLQPDSPEARIGLPPIPGLGITLYLDQVIPLPIHNVWTLVAAAIILVFLTKGIADYAGNYLVSYVGLSAITDLRQATFDKVLGAEAEFFETTSTGHLMSSIMNDIDKIQLAVSQMLADWLRQTFSAVFLLYVLFQSDWKLAAASLTVLPFVLLPTARFGRRIRRATRSAQDQAAEVSQILQETLSGNVVVKAFTAERHESERFRRAAEGYKRANLRYIAQQALPSPIIEFFGALTIVGLLSYARIQIKAGELTSGQFTGFVIALLMLYEPVKRLTGIHNIFQQAIGASQKVLGYIDRPQQIRERPGARPLPRFKEGIVFDRASFHYPNAPAGFAIRDLTLTVRAGEVLALVGPSGAGKSTIAGLVPRFYDVTAGSIRVDGYDVREVSLRSLREQIALVAQDTFLFDESVAANIRYGRRTATMEEVREAARNALAEEFILNLPDGYESKVGERGAKLSGGQRQRLAIARAILKNAPILILDEATSNLDVESELLVQQALGNLMTGRTVIVIAHRLSTIRRADRIIVIENGGIRETGTHEELVNHGGIYQRLHELQSIDLER
jgi:subfamily B ATP-binding cassette protein MsbA